MNKSAIKILFLYVILIFSSRLFSQENDKAIQAVASLLFHVQSEIEQTNNEISPVVFATKDIENLWSRALTLDSSLAHIQEEYWLWHRYQSDDQKATLQRCVDVLKSTWLTANVSEEIVPEERHPIHRLHEYTQANLQNNSLIDKKIQREIEPFLLPSNLQITPLVEQIFSASRPTLNSTAFVLAGFNILHMQPRSYIIVGIHPAIPGYLFKLYLDSELRKKNKVPGWKWFVKRCKGAELIRNVIIQKKIKNFTVPKKYIYVLPPATTPSKTRHINPKPVVLIVENMNLVNDDLNYAAWKLLVTPQILNELFIIISSANGSSYRPDNIPYTHSGTFAFIDTEYPHQHPDFNSIRPFLSSEMCNYWDRLIKEGGP